MNNDNINIYEDNFNDGFEDIEQMLKPQCEFKASKTLKDEVLRKAKAEVAPRRSIRMWPWAAAACVAGVLIMFLMPPKTNDGVVEDTHTIAKAEQPTTSTSINEQVEETTSEEARSVNIAPRSQNKSPNEVAPAQPTEESEPDEEPVQMSEETKMELLMAYLSPEEQMPREIDHEEEIRKLRQRGEHLLSMCKGDN